MSVRDEVRDPWSYVVGGLSGGLGWALLATTPAAPVALAVGAAVGAAVFGVKVLTGALTRPAGRGSGRRKRTPQERRLPVATRSQEAAWLARAQQAQYTFEDIASSARSGPVADEVRTFGEETAESLDALHRLAGQASAIRSAMARLDPKRLVWERDRLLAAARPHDDPRVLAERERSLNAVQTQLDAYGRLERTLTTLIARLESGTLGIEGLVARLAEVVALAETSSSALTGTSPIDELAHELEGLRAGLVEAESVTTRAMQGLAPLPAPGAGSVQAAPQENQSPARRRAGGE